MRQKQQQQQQQQRLQLQEHKLRQWLVGGVPFLYP
jgi:hypothetical protein